MEAKNNLSDFEKERKAFHDSQMGVKGLLDSGIKDIPKIFIRPSEELVKDQNNAPCLVSSHGPVIDFKNVEMKDRRHEIAKQVLSATKEWGFFQLVNHGIPVDVMDKLLEGYRMFHGQDAETKKQFYSRDLMKRVAFTSNNEFYPVKVADWRDYLAVHQGFDPEDLPEICRDVVTDYINHVVKLGDTLLELLSIGLGVSSSHLKEGRKWYLVNNYYPPCPAPELTLGFHNHTDSSIITLLVQDKIGGLQVLHEDQWVDIKPIPGAISLITGDLLQILTNGLIQSPFHRAISHRVGPRVSAALFVLNDASSPKFFGPIKELLSEDNPPIYTECTMAEYFGKAFNSSDHKHGHAYVKVASREATTV